MALPRPPLNPAQPIPNNPFFSPQVNFIQGSTGPLVVGAGLSINYTTGTISATGGGGGGGVTLVNTGAGLTGGPITSSGTISATPATTTVAGIACLATNALALAGTNATTALTPAAACCAFIQKSAITAKGSLITGTAACVPAALAVGTNGQVLVACSAATTGLCWVTSSLGPAIPTTFGTVLGCTNGSNSALGCNALLANTSGSGHVAVGLTSLCSNTTGVNNVAIGNAASCSNTVGSGNVAIGNAALFNAVDASRIVAIGENALCVQTTGGQYNVALGWAALCNATGTAGGSNVALGALAGNNITTGSSNVIIGPNVTVPFGNQDNQLAIGYNTGQCWLTGDSSKNVKFWAGIRANDDSLGAAGQGLLSTGTGVAWTSASGVSSWTFVGQMGGPGSPVLLTTSNGGNTTTTGSYNKVWTQQVGLKTWNVIYQYRASGAAVGYTNGEADFVFQLPGALSFDTNLPFQNTFTGSVRDNSQANRAYFLPGASSTQFNSGSNTGSEGGSGIIVWSGNKFRFMIDTDLDGGPRAWGTSYWNNVDTAINIGFQFQTP